VDESHHHGGGLGEASSRSVGEFFNLFAFLVVGSALAAAVQVFVDRDTLSAQQGVYLSIAAMMALAFVLSICSSVDAFVVAGLGASLGTGPLLAFLVLGPQVSLKTLPLYLRLFSWQAVTLLAVLVAQIAFVAAVVVQLRGW
jgi:uncharacterized membrane protein YraQ (UPF0718 family)